MKALMCADEAKGVSQEQAEDCGLCLPRWETDVMCNYVCKEIKQFRFLIFCLWLGFFKSVCHSVFDFVNTVNAR